MHRRKEFKAAPDSISKMLELENAKKINFLIGQIQVIEDLDNDRIKVITKNNEEYKSFEVDFLLPFFGLKMELGPIANWGLNLEKKTYLKVMTITDMVATTTNILCRIPQKVSPVFAGSYCDLT